MSERFLVGDDLWTEIRSKAAKSKSLVAVVGYLGRHPESVLRWPKKSTVICDLSPNAVERGASRASGALELHRKRITLCSVKGLHAKVYIFDTTAIVGSANLSESSTRLIEAGFVVTDRKKVAAMRKWAIRLQSDSLPMNDENILRELAKREPKQVASRRRPIAATAATVPFFDNDPVWFCTAADFDDDFDAEIRARSRHGSRIADEFDLHADRISWLSEVTRDAKEKIEQGHYILFWRQPRRLTKRAPYGYLDGPWQSLGGVDLGKRLGKARYTLPHIKRRHVSIPLDRRSVVALAKIIGWKVPKNAADLWDKLSGEVDIRLNAKMIRAFARFISARS